MGSWDIIKYVVDFVTYMGAYTSNTHAHVQVQRNLY